MISRTLTGPFFCSMLLISCTGTTALPHPTVCAIVDNPDSFLGQTITISGSWDASYHYTFIEDASCPKVGISLSIPDEAMAQKDIKQFMKLAYGVGDGPEKPQGRGVFIGQLRLEKPQGEAPHLVLDLHSFTEQ